MQEVFELLVQSLLIFYRAHTELGVQDPAMLTGHMTTVHLGSRSDP